MPASPPDSRLEHPIVNVAAYRFVTLEDLPARRAALQSLCGRLRLKGSILLSVEGINLFVAGGRAEIEELLSFLRSDPRLADLEVKRSFSADQPFNRMLVKIKQEIIAFSVSGIDPRQTTAPKLPAAELRRWLDERRPIALLDTRNDYEVEVGTFVDATPIGVDHFRDFPAAVRRLPDEWKERPVVMFCTGGIRCEKAGPFLLKEGFQKVYQLDGGILKYFEECGGAHYQGDCFVFDKRVALTPTLDVSEVVQCYVCQSPLTRDDRQSELYEPGESCPHCYRPEETRRADLLIRRQAEIRRLTDPLPGAGPYVNRLPLNVPKRLAGLTLLTFLEQRFPQTTSDEWQAALAAGRIVQNDRPAAGDRIVREGERFDHVMPDTVEPDVRADIRVLYEDDGLVVIDKPAPLPMHPCGRFHYNTLQHILNQVYRPQKLRTAHRLDANTSGVVVFCRTRAVARLVQPQFESRSVEKIYLARVAGHPAEDEFACAEPISDGFTEGGLRTIDAEGLPAETRFRVLRRDADGSCLLEARPMTGRTNQIRLHLWHLGFPVLGDSFYLPGGRLGTNQTLGVDAPPLCLHALRLAFDAPDDGRRLEFTAPAPDWA